MSERVLIGIVTALAVLPYIKGRTGSKSSGQKDVGIKDLEQLVQTHLEIDPNLRAYQSGFIEKLERSGFSIIGAGGSRIVVDLGNVIAKIEYDNIEPSTNRAEAENWYAYRGTEVQYRLVPVVATMLDDRILIMEKADTEITEQEWEEAMVEMPVHFYESDFKFNWGRHNEEIKLLDYPG